MQQFRSPLKRRESLSVRLLGITIGIILLVELIIFVPSAINFRNNWLDERLQASRIAVLSLEAAPSQSVSEELSRELLENAEVLSVIKLGNDRRELVLAPIEPIKGDMRTFHRSEESWFERLSHTFSLFYGAHDVIMKVDSDVDMGAAELEVLIPEAPLSQEIIDFSRRILGLSLLISIIAGGLVYLVLDIFVVRPIRKVTESIVKFRDNPAATRTEHIQSNRKDEIGWAQNALADMEVVVSDSFRQRQRLAQLGEAVAKINHDLRNSLAAAQLVSDGLANSEDPRVQRAAPRLERALERAINLAQDTLQYGKAEPAKPNLQASNISEIIQEATQEALSSFPQVKLDNQISAETTHNVDPDHLHRIISNLVRNAAVATVKVRPEDSKISVSLDGDVLVIADNGPGLPQKTLDNMFVPFAGSTTKGGSGLGLVIARELSQAMGGDLKLGATGKDGTAFHVLLPQ